MTLKETFNSIRADLRELKTAAQAHNVASYEPPASGSDPSKPAEGVFGSAPSTADGPPSPSPTTTTTNTEIQPSSDAPVVRYELAAVEQALPPPPPKNLPHGWTARYDKKESKFAYSHGVNSEKEQWDLRKEPLNLQHTRSLRQCNLATG